MKTKIVTDRFEKTRELRFKTAYFTEEANLKLHEYVTTVTTKPAIADISEWLDTHEIEHEYYGFVSDMDQRFESHWHIPNEKDRFLFTLCWGNGKLD